MSMMPSGVELQTLAPGDGLPKSRNAVIGYTVGR